MASSGGVCLSVGVRHSHTCSRAQTALWFDILLSVLHGHKEWVAEGDGDIWKPGGVSHSLTSFLPARNRGSQAGYGEGVPAALEYQLPCEGSLGCSRGMVRMRPRSFSIPPVCRVLEHTQNLPAPGHITSPRCPGLAACRVLDLTSKPLAWLLQQHLVINFGANHHFLTISQVSGPTRLISPLFCKEHTHFSHQSSVGPS